MFVPQDESSAWAWLPLGGRRDVPLADMNVKDVGGGEGSSSRSASPRSG